MYLFFATQETKSTVMIKDVSVGQSCKDNQLICSYN